MTPKRLARLIYLAAKLRERTPNIPKTLRRHVSQVEVIEACCLGIGGAASTLDIPVDELKKLARRGKKYGRASPEEFKLLVAKEVERSRILDDLPLNQRLRALSTLDTFVSQDESIMVGREEIRLGTVKDPPDVQKWESGFSPVDLVTGGLYQALMVFMAYPGGGKTSTMISLAECIKKEHQKWNILFFEQELPQKLMLSRMKPSFGRVEFGPKDLLVTGGVPMPEIMDRIKDRDKGGNKEKRVVFIDSPDTMPGLAAENRRFELGSIYRDLVRIKEQPQTQLVVAASQPNRKKRGRLTLDSVAESWEKAWLTDIVLGIQKSGFNRLRMLSLKNRFGIPDQEVVYGYDFTTLEFEDAFLEEEEGDWE